ncbi:MAG TPA: hypothetical protein VER11_13600 [Polyangiaceae bacterium]|nr:hypothetical protein [Polyangiaceae bacterium]
MKPESRVRSFRARALQIAVGASVTLTALTSPRAAHASSSYPPEVQKALDQQFGGSHCVPQCITCHLTNEGGIGTMNVFGKNLERYGMLPPSSPSRVVTAFDTYFKSTPPADAPQVDTIFANGTPQRKFFDSDSDGVSDYTELQQGDSPSIALPRGVDEVCPADVIMYGCFARVAAAPPPADRFGLFSVGLAVLGLAALRRSKRLRRST